MLANTPDPPFTAVIFSNQRRSDDGVEYSAAAKRMEELVQQQPGFLGVESVRDASGSGITVSYWTSESAAAMWKQQAEHLAVQDRGRSTFYEQYTLRICVVHRQVRFDAN